MKSGAGETDRGLAKPGLTGRQALVLVWIGLAVSGPAPARAAECADLLQAKCQSCHALARTCDGLGRDQESWRKSVARMAAYAPTITARDQKSLVKCLAKQKKDVLELCRP